jgi:GTP cyclohydrolase II
MILMHPRQTLQAFDAFLVARGLRLDAVVVGGAALELLGVVARTTRDCDILHPSLPPAILEAARDFAVAQRAHGEALDEDWLNNGPEQLAQALPPGWEQRTQPAFSGVALVLRAPGRMDLLRTKLFALCDRGTDLRDCLALAPLRDELEEARAWVERQDGNPDWPEHVRAVLGDLARRLGHVPA